MYKPRFSGPIHQVVKPKEYELYSERDVDTFIELKRLNDQIDALKQENEQLFVVRDKEQVPDGFVNMRACAKGLHTARDAKIENRYNQIKHQMH